MSETTQDYGPGPDDSSAFERRERFREWQATRELAIQLGDIYFELARVRARFGRYLGFASTGVAVTLLFRAGEQYQRAGLTRRGQAAWRYARALHAARTRETMR